MKKYFYQYVIAYKRNNKWYRDSIKHENLILAKKRLNELKEKNKYEDYKITYREISKWYDLGDE